MGFGNFFNRVAQTATNAAHFARHTVSNAVHTTTRLASHTGQTALHPGRAIDHLASKVAEGARDAGHIVSDGGRLAWRGYQLHQEFNEGVREGLWQGGKNAVVGTFETVTHPVQTLEAVAQVVRDPSATFDMVKESLHAKYEEFADASTEEQMKMLGNLTGQVGFEVLATKGVGAAVSKGNQALKAARVGAQFSKVAHLGEVVVEGMTALSTRLSAGGLRRAAEETVALSARRGDAMLQLDELLNSSVLSQNAQGQVTRTRNALQHHLKPEDLVGALRDKNGIPVINQAGKAMDHLQEVEGVLVSLERARNSLTREMRRYEPGTEEYSTLLRNREALDETARQTRNYLEIK